MAVGHTGHAALKLWGSTQTETLFFLSYTFHRTYGSQFVSSICRFTGIIPAKHIVSSAPPPPPTTSPIGRYNHRTHVLPHPPPPFVWL